LSKPTKRRFEVVGFGALNMDKLFKVNKIALPSEESSISGGYEMCGGSAANTMVGLARIGCHVGFVGKVSKDKEGKRLVEDLRREGVDVKGITYAKQGRSGVTLGFVDKKGERALYVNPGVNDTIQLEEVDRQYIFQTKFLHLTSFVGETTFETQKKIVERAPSEVKISFDPGELYARKGLNTLGTILKRTFILMPNLGELQLLTNEVDYKEGAEILLENGPQIVAIKMGDKGCYVTDGEERHTIEAFRVTVVDTTGAGDAFCSGFLYGLLLGKTHYECGRIGNFFASKCLMKIGARPGLPRIEELKLLN
jgi:ribokinase